MAAFPLTIEAPCCEASIILSVTREPDLSRPRGHVWLIEDVPSHCERCGAVLDYQAIIDAALLALGGVR